MRAKDQLHPYLSDLMAGYSRFKASAEWEGRGKILHWYVFFSREPLKLHQHLLTACPGSFSLFDGLRLITLNALTASDEISDEQSRQVRMVHCAAERSVPLTMCVERSADAVRHRAGIQRVLPESERKRERRKLDQAGLNRLQQRMGYDSARTR